MLRKMLLIASAVAIPLGATAVTTVAQSGPAGATALAITCKVSSGIVTFAPPGISQNGSFEAASTSTTNTNTVKYKCSPPAGSTGTTNPLAITTASTQCTAPNVPVTGCTVGQYNYDSTSGFAGSASTLWSDIGNVSIKIGSTTYTDHLTSSAVLVTCASGEAGFSLKGKLTAPAAHAGETAKLSTCLGTDTGPGTTGVFANDFGAAGVTIATAALMPDSKFKIS
jgi:hypothetical protein